MGSVDNAVDRRGGGAAVGAPPRSARNPAGDQPQTPLGALPPDPPARSGGGLAAGAPSGVLGGAPSYSLAAKPPRGLGRSPNRRPPPAPAAPPADSVNYAMCLNYVVSFLAQCFEIVSSPE